MHKSLNVFNKSSVSQYRLHVYSVTPWRWSRQIETYRSYDKLCKKSTILTLVQKKQLDAAMIYWSIRSAQRVFEQYFAHHQEGETEIFTAYGILLLWWVGRRWAAHRLPTHHNNRIPYAVNISVSRSWCWAKYCSKHVELIL